MSEETKALLLAERANSLEIKTQADVLSACSIYIAMKEMETEISSFFIKQTQQAHQLHKSLIEEKNRALAGIPEAKELLKDKLEAYANQCSKQVDETGLAVIDSRLTPPGSRLYFKDEYDFRVVDFSLIPSDYLMVDERKIKNIINKTAGIVEIPGIEVIQRKKMIG